MILPQKMPMLLPGIFLAADGFDDVLAIEHADQTVDLRDVVQQLGLMSLDEAAGDDDALAFARSFSVRPRVGFPPAIRSCWPPESRRY